MTYINPSAKLFQHLDTLAAIKRGERPAPVNVEWFLSNRCSHGCSWCRYGHTHTRGPLAGKMARPAEAVSGGDLMDFDLAMRILQQLSMADVKSITWTGGGEPTLHPRFNEIIGAAYNVKFEQGMYTHGGHITDDRANIIKGLFKWVYVSLDECTPEAFKANKGVDRFDAVLDGIRRLVAAEGHAKIGVGFLLHPGNWRDTHSMVKLGKELGVDYVQFRPTVLHTQDAPNVPSENTNWVTSAVAHLCAYQDDSFVIADINRFLMYRDWSGHGYSTCYGSALQTVITPNGKVWRCTNKNEHASALLGDLTQESFAELWARSGGPCSVDNECALMCRQHLSNISLQTIMADVPHGNFI